jgi:hypothetical protein
MERDIFFGRQSPDEEAYGNPESQSDKKDHRIRGHHIKFYFDAMKWDKYRPVGGIRTYAKIYVEKSLINHPDLEYRKDMGEDASVLARNYTHLYDEFVHLDDDDQVMLVEGQKDSTCQTCPVIGDHCTPQSPAELQSAIENDAKGVDKFMKKAKELGISDDNFKITEETLEFPNTHQEQARVITTTARVVKNILRNSSRIDWQEQ